MITSATPAAPRRNVAMERLVLERERRYYVLASSVLLVATLIGFRYFLLGGKGAGGMPITPEIVSLAAVHGIAMLTWVVLLLVQSLLIVGGQRRLHMTLGRGGAVLAGLVVIFSLVVAPLSARYNPGLYEAFGGSRYFLMFSLTAPILFAIFVTLGITYRNRPDMHRPFMLLATTVMMGGSFDRWPYVDRLIELTNSNVPVVHWGPMLLLGAIFFALHAVMTRRPSRWFAIGYGAILLATQLSVLMAGSATWDKVAALAVP